MRIVDNKAVEEALQELALLDDKEAELRAAREYGEAKLKEIYSRHYLKAEGTIAAKDAEARLNPEYVKHNEDLRMVIQNHQAAKNKRETLTMVKEVWQTENANLRGRT